jgi:hypothetical protein
MEKAYNARDMYAFLECFEPKVQQFAQGMSGLAGGLFGLSGSGDMMPLLSTALGATANDDEWGTAEISEISTEIDDDSATMQYHMEITFPDNDDVQTFDETMHLVKIDGEWYISADDLLGM